MSETDAGREDAAFREWLQETHPGVWMDRESPEAGFMLALDGNSWHAATAARAERCAGEVEELRAAAEEYMEAYHDWMDDWVEVHQDAEEVESARFRAAGPRLREALAATRASGEERDADG